MTQDRRCQQLNSILDDAGGFARTNEQERFDECEEAVHSLLQDVRQFARQLKVSRFV